MVLSVGGRLFREPGSLSERSQLVLSLIPSGPEWLAWAISDRSAHFAFPDEEALLTELPNLHGSALVLLPALGLLARPAQLITLEIDALNDLLAAEQARTAASTAPGSIGLPTATTSRAASDSRVKPRKPPRIISWLTASPTTGAALDSVTCKAPR